MPSISSKRRLRRSIPAVAVAAALAATAGACGSTGKTNTSAQPAASPKSNFTGTVTIGVPTVLTGPFAGFGQGADRGINAAIAQLNASGGVLGKQVKAVFEDDGAKVSTALTNSRNMILNDHAVALLGASTSSTAAAEAGVASQYHVPLLLWGGNDISLTTTDYNSYVFQLEPSTYMEPLAFAQYMAKLPYTRYYFIAPNYSFGHDDVNSFTAQMKKDGVKLKVVGTSYVPLFLTNYDSYITAAMATHPQVIFLGIFSGDEETFIKQAESYGLFSKVKVAGPTGTDVMAALGSETPAGMILNDRSPYFAIANPAARAYAASYHASYGSWPTEWALLGYSAVQTWAQGVEKAKSFGGPAVSSALSGATVSTIRGTFQIRACDHQAVVPDYFGVVPSHFNPSTGFALTNIFASDPSKTMMPCTEAMSLQPHP